MPQPEEIVSVILATRDRCRLLAACLETVAGCRFERDRFEVLVVDNGSKDATSRVLKDEQDRNRLPLRWISEPRPGKSAALNAGVAAARGRYLVFLDDDEAVAPGWLVAFDRSLRVEQHPMVQGRIIPRFLAQRPQWLSDEFLPWFGQVDQGDAAGLLAGNVHGGDLGVNKAVFDAIGGFRTDLGPEGVGLAEDTEFGRRAATAGFQAVYEPEALIHHLIPRNRATRSAFIRRRYLAGMSQPLFQTYDEASWRLPASLGRLSLRRLLKAGLSASGSAQVRELGEMAEHFGRVRQILRMRRHG